MSSSQESTREQKISVLEAQMQAPDFWRDKAQAQAVIAELNQLKQEASGAGGYDAESAIITIFSGAGGDDAEDFTRMLFEMYCKFAARRGYEVSLIHEHQNDHGGYRNLTFAVRGKGAYGILKNESGVHRLVRLSPFNSKQLRHTSFSLVEVIPEFKRGVAVELRPEDLEIEFARSSGPGGQNVNKRETAVRIVHTPTGLVAHSSAERSQERNREQAMALLRGKIYKKQEEDRRARERGMQISSTTEIEWGSQIRSYVLHPYKLVKDHRTGLEVRDPDRVLGGDLDEFVEQKI